VTQEPPATSAGYAPQASEASGAGSLAGPGTRGREPGPAGKVGEGGRYALAAAMTEAELEEHVRSLCGGLGLLAYHTRDSRRSVKGFPDFVICGRRVIYRELKTLRGRATGEQRRWIHALNEADADAGIWRPDDLLLGVIARDLTAISRLASAA